MATEEVRKDVGWCVYCNSTVSMQEFRKDHIGALCVGGGQYRADRAARETIEKMVNDAIVEKEADQREAARLEQVAKSTGDRDLFMVYSQQAAALRRKWKP